MPLQWHTQFGDTIKFLDVNVLEHRAHLLFPRTKKRTQRNFEMQNVMEIFIKQSLEIKTAVTKGASKKHA